MRVVEQYVAAKSGDPEKCEDGVVVTPHFAAVIDGATDKTGRRFGGTSGGRFVMLVLAETVRSLPPDIDAGGALDALTAAVAARLPAGLPPEDRPAAAATLYSAARHEVWQIGDVGFKFAGRPAVLPRKEVDLLNVRMRAAILRAELIRGATVDQLAAKDVGREAIMPLLTRQVFFANAESPEAGDLAYAVLDGRPVPKALVHVVPSPPDTSELVIASDGYPEVFGTLSDTETHLKVLLAEDPLCIRELAGTKGVALGNDSFDDRAYLRLEL
jgi:hypothetical protein